MGEKPSGWKLASNALHELWSLREQSDTKSIIERHLFKNTQASSSSSDSESLTQTYWVMRHQDGISELLDYSGLSGILIREEYTKALNAVIRFAETGKAADDDENKESDQSEAGVDDDHYYNLFLNLSDCQKSNGGFIVIGHPGIGESPNLSLKIEKFSLFCRENCLAHSNPHAASSAWFANNLSIEIGSNVFFQRRWCLRIPVRSRRRSRLASNL